MTSKFLWGESPLGPSHETLCPSQMSSELSGTNAPHKYVDQVWFLCDWTQRSWHLWNFLGTRSWVKETRHPAWLTAKQTHHQKMENNHHSCGVFPSLSEPSQSLMLNQHAVHRYRKNKDKVKKNTNIQSALTLTNYKRVYSHIHWSQLSSNTESTVSSNWMTPSLVN